MPVKCRYPRWKGRAGKDRLRPDVFRLDALDADS
jgi:hypothetical protein